MRLFRVNVIFFERAKGCKCTYGGKKMTSSEMKNYLKKKKRKRAAMVSVFLAVLVLGLALGYAFLIRPAFLEDDPGTADTEVPQEPATESGFEAIDISANITEPEPEPEPFDEFDIHVMMVGDDLLHMGLVNQGVQADGTRNYVSFSRTLPSS